MSRAVLLVVSLFWLSGCSGLPPDAQQRAATDLNPSGRPYNGPQIYQPQSPPNSTNAFDPLYCHPEQSGTVCTRQPK